MSASPVDAVLKKLELPAIPMVAAKVTQLMASANCSLEELQEVISGDPAVVSRLLRIANSAFYSGGRRTIESARDAVMTMGFDTLKNMVLSSSLRDVYKNFGLFEKMSWEHSIGVSVAAGMLARDRGMRQDEASTAGLLHDIGKVVINNNMPEKYASVIETVYSENTTAWEAEDAAFGFNHCTVGEVVGRKWQLSPALVTALGYHHFPEKIPADQEDGKALCNLVRQADQICLYLGVGRSSAIADALDNSDMNPDELMPFIDGFKTTFVKEKLKFMD